MMLSCSCRCSYALKQGTVLAGQRQERQRKALCIMLSTLALGGTHGVCVCVCKRSGAKHVHAAVQKACLIKCAYSTSVTRRHSALHMSSLRCSSYGGAKHMGVNLRRHRFLGAHSFVARLLRHSTIKHASLPKRRATLLLLKEAPTFSLCLLTECGVDDAVDGLLREEGLPVEERTRSKGRARAGRTSYTGTGAHKNIAREYFHLIIPPTIALDETSGIYLELTT